MSQDKYLDGLLDQRVVVDVSSQYVVLGEFTGYNEHFLELKTRTSTTFATRKPPEKTMSRPAR